MQIIMSIWALSLVVGLLGCIPYAIWIIRTAIKKRWKKVGIQFAIPTAFFALLAGATAIAQSYASDRYSKDFYDTDVKLAEPVFKFDSGRSFNGDGASIYIYELPEKIRHRFENQDRKLLSEYPKRPYYRRDWSSVTWKEAPFDANLERYLDFALSGAGDHSAEIRDALSREGTFYSFFHNDYGGSAHDIDFFIVDLQVGRIYVINVNT
jgi:hypothetical protein